jgi:uncharacterized protein
MNPTTLIQTLQLQPHPEGGFYRETYRSGQLMTVNGSNRNVSTAIYFLLENKNRSRFHRIKSDELWFFHQGQPLEIVSIVDGHLQKIILGSDVMNGQSLQAVIPANTWFAAKVKDGSGFSLVSCAVAPGFDFADFELANSEELIRQFPDLKEEIVEFT